MRRFALQLFGLGFALSLAAIAVAQPPGGQPGGLGGQPPDPNVLFKQLDRNGDGQLTANELPNVNLLPPPIRAILNSADKNRDGAISLEEFVSSFPGRPGGNGPPNGNGPLGGNGPPNGNGPLGGNGPPGIPGFGPGGKPTAQPPTPIKTAEMDKIFRRLDANHDNKLSTDEVPSEYRDLIDKLIASADKNQDGALNKVEFRDGLKRLPELGEQLGESDPKFMFQQMDTSGDGQLTADEIPAAHRALFERLLAAGDKDGDGALSKREFGKASAQSQPKPAAGVPKPASKKKPADAPDAPAQPRP